jgi:mono/diheme cytochrome c family protein
MKRYWAVLAFLLIAACSKSGQEAGTATPPTVAVPRFDPASVARGAKLFEQDCAQCHGPRAQGHPDWQTPSNGSFAAAPPLNGTGNDWKRSRAELATIIKNGMRRKSDNTDIMPAWKGRLNDSEIEDVLNWLQSLWPADVYQAWSKTQGGAPAPKG